MGTCNFIIIIYIYFGTSNQYFFQEFDKKNKNKFMPKLFMYSPNTLIGLYLGEKKKNVWSIRLFQLVAWIGS
jgi:hypothetical protein